MLFRGARHRPKWLEITGLQHRKERFHSSPWRWPFRLALALVVLLALARKYQGSNVDSLGSHDASRHLLSANDSDSGGHGLEWESCTFEESTGLKYGWLVFFLLCVLIIFVALAIVCDDFFVPSLEGISESLNLSEDVAGATFMAAGSSAPELFSSVVGMIQGTDVGVGTIVGSAVFNILIIIALTAALAGQILHIDWRPLARDSFFYGLSIIIFIQFSWDGMFHVYESAILVSLYVIYIVLMVFNPKLMAWMGTWRCCCSATVLPVKDDESEDPDKSASPDALTDQTNVQSMNGSQVMLKKEGERKLSMGPGGHARRLSIISQKSKHSGDHEHDRHIFHHTKRHSIIGGMTIPHQRVSVSYQPSEVDGLKEEKEELQTEVKIEEEEEEAEGEEEGLKCCPCCDWAPRIRTSPPSKDECNEKGGCMAWFKYILRWVIFVVAFPFVLMFSWTIPDCSKEEKKRSVKKMKIGLSFVMSLVWITILSFGMVTLVGRSGCIIGIDSFTMALIIIAIGTSVPDAMSSILVARDGFGDMAVSNAIGSNVFDINLGLGLPFIIRNAITNGEPVKLLDANEQIMYDAGLLVMTPHSKFGFILLLILAFTLIVFGINRFRLNKWIGISFCCCYVLFIVYALIQDSVCYYNC